MESLPLVQVRSLFVVILFLSIFSVSVFAQDSLVSADTVLGDSITQLDTAQQIQNTRESTDFGSVRKSNSGSAVFFIGLGAFLLFGLLRFVYSKHLAELVTVLSKSTLGRMTSKDSLWQNFMPRGLFMAIYYATSGHIVGQLIDFISKDSIESLTLWFWGISVVMLSAIMKWLAVRAVAVVFNFNKTAAVFFNHLSVVNQALGFVLLPICGAMLLLPAYLATILLFVALFVLLISLIFKVLINIGYVRNLPSVSFLHFILYLCTLEIIPLAVCVRYVHNSIGA